MFPAPGELQVERSKTEARARLAELLHSIGEETHKLDVVFIAATVLFPARVRLCAGMFHTPTSMSLGNRCFLQVGIVRRTPLGHSRVLQRSMEPLFSGRSLALLSGLEDLG
jgi:hypothetical protein